MPKSKLIQLIVLLFLLGGVSYLGWMIMPAETRNMISSQLSKFAINSPDSITTTPSLTEAASPTPSSTTPGSPKPTRSPYPLLPDKGKSIGTFQVSQGKHDGPTFRQIILSPLIVSKGSTLNISVTLETTNEITEVKGVFTLDHSKQNLTFSKVSRSGLQEVWETKVTLADTVLYDYSFTLNATDGSGISYMAFAPRSTQ